MADAITFVKVASKAAIEKIIVKIEEINKPAPFVQIHLSMHLSWRSKLVAPRVKINNDKPDTASATIGVEDIPGMSPAYVNTPTTILSKTEMTIAKQSKYLLLHIENSSFIRFKKLNFYIHWH